MIYTYRIVNEAVGFHTIPDSATVSGHVAVTVFDIGIPLSKTERQMIEQRFSYKTLATPQGIVVHTNSDFLTGNDIDSIQRDFLAPVQRLCDEIVEMDITFIYHSLRQVVWLNNDGIAVNLDCANDSEQDIINDCIAFAQQMLLLRQAERYVDQLSYSDSLSKYAAHIALLRQYQTLVQQPVVLREVGAQLATMFDITAQQQAVLTAIETALTYYLQTHDARREIMQTIITVATSLFAASSFIHMLFSIWWQPHVGWQWKAVEYGAIVLAVVLLAIILSRQLKQRHTRYCDNNEIMNH